MHKQLTKNFTLAEMTHSNYAMRHGIKNQPDSEQIQNLTRLCRLVLQPVRDAIGVPIHVSSGYRCVKLNRAIGGVKHSQHLMGLAADIVCEFKTASDIFKHIRESDLPFDQVILEFGRWVHVSVAPHGAEPRRRALIAERINSKTRYTEASTRAKH